MSSGHPPLVAPPKWISSRLQAVVKKVAIHLIQLVIDLVYHIAQLGSDAVSTSITNRHAAECYWGGNRASVLGSPKRKVAHVHQMEQQMRR